MPVALMRLQCRADQLAEDSRERCTELGSTLDLTEALVTRLNEWPTDWRSFLARPTSKFPV